MIIVMGASSRLIVVNVFVYILLRRLTWMDGNRCELEYYREISVSEALVPIMRLMLRNLLLTFQKFYETSSLVLFT